MKHPIRAAALAAALALCPAAPSAAQRPAPAPRDAAQQQQPPAPDGLRDEADEGPCPEAMTQHAMNQCAAAEFRKADAELNKVYQRLMREAGAAEKAKLRAAQLAWIKFRDSHCDYESFGNKGGSIYPMVYSFCLAKLTRGRTEQFKEIIKEGEALNDN
jgi:uncharacterized protein YecT (DUF1311 family)